MVDNKKLTGAVCIVGLSVLASYLMLKNYVDRSIENAYQTNSYGENSAANSPTSLVGADFMTPVATIAAPRMYVAHKPGAEPSANPGESWLQGGGASITNSTGRWADFPGDFGGSFVPNGIFNATETSV